MATKVQVKYEKFGARIVRAKLPALTPRQVHALRTKIAIRTLGALRKSTWVLIDEKQKKELETTLAEVLASPPAQPFVVPVYFDYQSQNSWLAVPVCERLAEKYEVTFSWRAFQQRPYWKPVETPAASKEAMASRWEQSLARAKELGVPLAKTRPPHRFNTRWVHMCTEYARLHGKEMDLINALLEAMHGRHEDISNFLVADKIAERVGLSVPEMDEAVESGAFEGLLDQHRADAAKAGVFGVPTFIVDGQLIWGRATLDEVEEALKQAGVPRRG
ncbi:MAG: DsbA family protein, partial [Nitrospinota bacterium]